MRNWAIIQAEEGDWALDVYTTRGDGAVPCHLVREALLSVVTTQGMHPNMYANPEDYLSAAVAVLGESRLFTQRPKLEAYLHIPLYGCKVMLPASDWARAGDDEA